MPTLPQNGVRLQCGMLWRAIVDRSRDALARGALLPIETQQKTIDDSGVRFMVRRVSTLAHKAAQRPAKRDDACSIAHTFPVESELFLAKVSDTHMALLNKFPVIPHHVVLVTQQYVPQEALLDHADFAALACCLSEYEALGFYNGGATAGASHPHKHLQLVPLPLGCDRTVPIESLLDHMPRSSTVTTVPGLPFRHAFCRCEALLPGAAERLSESYRGLLAAVGIHTRLLDGVPHQCAPYNVLVTQGWMLLVARTRGDFDGISINALGYAGSLFVKSDGSSTVCGRLVL
ncbi:MAG: ATP adenylyltransferase family protein [Rhodospirillaceae bacterium]